MAAKLFTLPLRLSLRSAQLLTRAAGGVAEQALAIPARAIQVVSSGRPGRAKPDAEPDAAPSTSSAPQGRGPMGREEPATETGPSGAGEHPPVPFPKAAAPAAEPAAAPPQVFEEPAHVSAEPVLVRDSAEPGAEEGAGARITVIEPWAGYGHMNARDVIDRVRTASVAELAAMRLYEARHRARRTVLAAVDRQLKLAGAAHPA